MPAGPRIRQNGIFGTTTDNPLTAGAGTFNSAELADMQVVAAAHATVTFDPLKQFGDPEIVIVTAHTAAATVATITRGAYGTVARSHPQGTLWVHAAVDEDFIEVLTSGTLPTDPFAGQVVFETDTDTFSYRDAANTAWKKLGLALGQLGYSQNTSTNTSLSTTIGVFTALPPTTTSTFLANRRVKITGQTLFNFSTANNMLELAIFKDGALGQSGQILSPVTGGSGQQTLFIQWVETPGAGPHTYDLRATRRAGSGAADLAVASASDIQHILVEDIGPA